MSRSWAFVLLGGRPGDMVPTEPCCLLPVGGDLGISRTVIASGALWEQQ